MTLIILSALSKHENNMLMF